MCPKCHKAYKGGGPFRKRDLVIRQIGALRLEDEFVHAACPVVQRRAKLKEPKTLLDIIENAS